MNDFYTNTIPFTDPCGPLVVELYDFTSHVETPLDQVLFTDQTLALSTTSQLSITSSLPDIGVYTIRVKVYYQDFPLVVANRDFLVSIEPDCLSQTLTPSTSVFLPPAAVTVQQFVGYPTQQLSWTDSDVLASIGLDPDPCGSLTTHQETTLQD